MKRYSWAATGDINAFCGLMLDNVANLVLVVTLLASSFQLPATFTIRYMIPGTALGVLAGDLLFTAYAFRTARRTGNNSLTAMPLGLDTPSTLGMIFFVVGPAFQRAKQSLGLPAETAAEYAWKMGICAILVSGVFKIACALGAKHLQRVIPRAGLLGSLTAIALVLISFIPLLDIAAMPVVGFAALVIILTTLTARVSVPGRMPGAVAALAAGLAIYHALRAMGWITPHPEAIEAQLGFFPPHVSLDWWHVFRESLGDLPVVLPFALATVIGGIDCTESAAAAGDHYDARCVVAIEGVATLVAGLCGGIIQTTPYIGHPAYKAMGARAGYTLLTALFIGGAGLFGYFSYLYVYLPKPAIYPILLFVGLEITAQSFSATPKRHYPAVALACVPALAYLVMIFVDQALAGQTLEQVAQPTLREQLQTMRTLSAGFIVTSMLWAGALAALIDQRLRKAAGFLAAAAAATLFGVIHSPFPGQPLFLPWNLPELPAAAAGQSPWHWAGAYLLAVGLLLAWSPWVAPRTEEELDRLHGHGV